MPTYNHFRDVLSVDKSDTGTVRHKRETSIVINAKSQDKIEAPMMRAISIIFKEYEQIFGEDLNIKEDFGVMHR